MVRHFPAFFIPEISEKEDILVKYTQIKKKNRFEKFSTNYNSISVPEFQNFPLKGSHFRNSAVSKFFGKRSQEMSIPFFFLSKILEFLVEWKAP